MKELDESTLKLVRHLSEKQRDLGPSYRNLRIVVVWVDGDAERLASWAEEHKVTDVPLFIGGSSDDTLQQWQLNPMAMKTVVFMDRVKPVCKIIDLRSSQLSQIEEQITEHFQRYRR